MRARASAAFAAPAAPDAPATRSRRRRGRTVVTCANPLSIRCDRDLPRVQLTVLEPTYDAASGAVRGTNVLYEASVRFDSVTQSLVIEASRPGPGRSLPRELLAYNADVRLGAPSHRGIPDRVLRTPRAGVLAVAS